MPENNLSQKFQVHYYFDDESHSMNAFVRNRAEKDLLEAIKRIGELLESPVQIETEAYKEGGLLETISLVVLGDRVLKYFSPSINAIVIHHLTKTKTDDAIKEETLKNLKLDSEIKQLNIDERAGNEEVALQDTITRRHISNYYTKINAYEKVEKIGFKNLSAKTDELVIPRSKFKDFILIDEKTVIEDDDAEIEIISPVLKEGTFNWRGAYKELKIDFSMGDSKFKSEVTHGQHQFASGFLMNCLLQITTTFDEFGDEKRRSYSVRKVYSIKESGSSNFSLRPLGYKKKEKADQQLLFDGKDGGEGTS